MPDDVSDLRDVVDAINRLCETMKTSEYECEREDEPISERVDDVSEVELVNPGEVVVNEVETYVAELWSDASSNLIEEATVTSEPSPVRVEVVETVVLDSSLVRDEVKITVASDRSLHSIENVVSVTSSRPVTQVSNIDTVAFGSLVSDVENVEIAPSNRSIAQIENIEFVANSNRTTTRNENVEISYKTVVQADNAESVASDPSPTKIEDIRTAMSDPENLTSCEPVSEMYYTASSEVSLLSDFELPERVPQEESVGDRETLTRDDRNGVIAGHVAAMRERFESMTRTNTPCPDLARSVSPSLDVYRNITPSPDHLG